jgi:carboxymethylenebutenolidase
MTVKNLPEKLNYLQRYLVEEYVEDFQEGLLTRRQALKTLAGVLGSAAAANALPACMPAPQRSGLPRRGATAGGRPPPPRANGGSSVAANNRVATMTGPDHRLAKLRPRRRKA